MKFFNPKSRYFWITVWALFGMAVGAIIICTQTTIDKSSAYLWAFGYALSGGVVGILFGIPKVITGNPTGTPPSTAETQNIINRSLQENTNLSDISDWLTKVIIGASLVQLREIPPYIMRIGRRMGAGMATNTLNAESASIFSVSLLLYATVLGFFIGYFVARFIVTDMLQNPGNLESAS